MGYRQHGSATATKGSFDGPACGPDNGLIASLDAPRMRAALGDHLAALEESLGGPTARQIATTRGSGGSKAGERNAVRAQDNALAALAAIEKKLAA